MNYGNLNYESHIKEYKIVIRDAFNSIIFVIELLEKIINSEKVEEIIISGWNNYISPYSIKNYFIDTQYKKCRSTNDLVRHAKTFKLFQNKKGPKIEPRTF